MTGGIYATHVNCIWNSSHQSGGTGMSTANSAVGLLRAQYKSAHDILEATLQDVTSEIAHWSPPGISNPLGATYAHVAAAEDAILNGMARGAAPLLATSWAGKVGVNENVPLGGRGENGAVAFKWI
jgi:hypothetical protein